MQIPLPAAGSAADHPIDLVVSLTRQPSADTDHHLQLFYITVTVPVGSRDSDLLRAGTRPSGVRMLKNMRFNVHVRDLEQRLSDGSQQSYLVFSVIPRSRGSLVPLDRTADASFVISQVWMNQVPGLVGIDVQESYRWQNGTNRLAPGAYQNVSALNSLDLEKV